MGYTWHFFEFPHYAASALQRQLAEERYNIVYQQYADPRFLGQLVLRDFGNHTCLWIPTPADCVHSPYDSDGIAERLTASHDAGREISLYFHPAMDYRCMRVQIDGDTMRWIYNEESGILGRIIRMTDAWGYRFSAAK